VYILLAAVVFCPASWEHNWHGVIFCGIMYGTYLYLFGKLTVAKVELSKSLSQPSSPSMSPAVSTPSSPTAAVGRRGKKD
jgi:hypothetical protein